MLLASIDGLVRQTILRTLRAHFRATGSTREDVDDIRGEVTVALLRRLRDPDEGLDDIRSFPAYAATVASRACYAYLRRRYPAWTRLKNQIRYIVTHDAELTLRDSEDKAPRCQLLSVRRDERRGEHAQAMPLRDAIKTVIGDAGGSMELNELVGTIADMRGIREITQVAPAVADIEAIGAAPPSNPHAGAREDDVELLEDVWREVRQLPVRQRIALLLSLRDRDGRGVLALFQVTEVASMHEIAGTLGMGESDLARVWNELPLDDNRIAARLGVTRQQVINLRKSARARLSRRMMVIGAASAHLHK